MTDETHDGQYDFDFEFGSWTTELSRLASPLSGSTDWVENRGTSVVRPIWHGAANLVELDVTGPSGRIQALSLRLYDPAARHWSIHSASIRGGGVSPAGMGQFRDGQAEFLSEESLDGRPILVRFVISDITPTSCRFEQSFSDDGGRTWETNWIAEDTRIGTPPGKAQ
jgi:hypothetical protein